MTAIQALEGTPDQWTLNASGRSMTRTVNGKAVEGSAIDPTANFRFTEDFYSLVNGKFVRQHGDASGPVSSPGELAAAFNKGWNACLDAIVLPERK
jgi:hypothetical protein